MARYSRSAGKDVKSAMRRRKKGTLKSGKGGKGGTVKSRKQAIAIGLSEARKKGKKVPRRKSARRSGHEAHAPDRPRAGAGRRAPPSRQRAASRAAAATAAHAPPPQGGAAGSQNADLEGPKPKRGPRGMST